MRNWIFLFALVLFVTSCTKDDQPLNSTAFQNEESLDRDATVPFKAAFVTYPTIVVPPPFLVLEIPGEGKASHMGKVTMFSNSQVNLTVFPFVQTGDMLITAADGSTLVGYFAGIGFPDPDNPQGVTYSGDYELTGGTGRFEGATGSGTYYGAAVTGDPTGLGDLYFEGTLTNP
jgi:hypothetical protein